MQSYYRIIKVITWFRTVLYIIKFYSQYLTMMKCGEKQRNGGKFGYSLFCSVLALHCLMSVRQTCIAD